MTYKHALGNEEKKAFQELQNRMRNVLPPNLNEDPTLFYRFLKARDYDVDKAQKMLMKHIAWRKTHQVDTVLDDFKPREFFHKYTEPAILGFGKEEDLILYCPTGKLEISDTLKCVTMNEYMKCWIWFMERNLRLLKEHNEQTGKESSQITFIIDLDQLTFSNAADKSNADLWLRLVHLFQDNYPERMKAVYVINAPSYYVVVYSLLKKVMSGAMIQKIHILGKTGYKEKFLDIIDANLLPAFLGGNRTDPDGNPLCNSFVCHGGQIPSVYHLPEEDRYIRNNTRAKKISVGKKEQEEIVVNVAEPGSLIKWEFIVRSGDIGFGLSYKLSERDVRELLPMEYYNTSDGKEVGSYRCQSTGKYVIIFENSNAWLQSREVEYCVTVLGPE